jgi:hypothetical protein
MTDKSQVQRPVALSSWLQKENEMCGHNMITLKSETCNNKDINEVVGSSWFLSEFWSDVGHVTEKSGDFCRTVGLHCCWWLCLCVPVGEMCCCSQWGRTSPALHVKWTVKLLQDCSTHTHACWDLWFRSSGCCYVDLRKATLKQKCDILHLVVNMPGSKGPWTM